MTDNPTSEQIHYSFADLKADVMSTVQTAEFLGVDAGQVNRLKKNNELFWMRDPFAKAHFPRSQFDGTTVKPTVRAVLQVLSPLNAQNELFLMLVAFWLHEPNDALGGNEPLDHGDVEAVAAGVRALHKEHTEKLAAERQAHHDDPNIVVVNDRYYYHKK